LAKGFFIGNSGARSQKPGVRIQNPESRRSIQPSYSGFWLLVRRFFDD
jgi:hypothetical protein